MMKFRNVLALVLLGAFACTTQAQANGVAPLEAQIDMQDALRFAKLFDEKKGVLTKEDIQKGYLDNAGTGVKLFTPYRIEDAANLANAVKADARHYRYAIDKCLPVLSSLNSELRAVYLAYRGLLPNQALPRVSVVFGARNSGGMADKENQVIGLEVMCGEGTALEDFRRGMRLIFAHEAVHSMQTMPSGEGAFKDFLLIYAIMEGGPDYLSSLVTGREPSVERDNWGKSQEAQIWAKFNADRKLLQNRKGDDLSKEPDMLSAMQRWFGNVGSAPVGIPSEAGYWVGMQIAKAYVEQSADKARAIADLLNVGNAQQILDKSGYEKRMGQALKQAKP